MINKSLIFTISLLAFISCSTIEDIPSLKTDSPPNIEYGYFVGTLSIFNRSTGNGGFGLLYTNLDDEKQSVILTNSPIKRNINDPIQNQPRSQMPVFLKDMIVIIPVKPGRYKLTQTLFLYYRIYVKGQKEITNMPLHTREILVKPGSLYYIGDWIGSYSYSSTDRGETFRWSIDSVNDRFDETKAAIQSDYPYFKNWQLINTTTP